MSRIYLDNSATTALCDAAKNAMMRAMECYGNPSSLHTAGLEAEHMVRRAREQVEAALGVRKGTGTIYFTASGTEANNLAIMGSVFAKERLAGKRIVTTEGEHSSVEATLRELEKKGFEVVRIPTKNGVIDMDFAGKAIDKNTILVTAMMVNNETGALYDLKSLFALAKRNAPGVVTHCDAVQGFMKAIFSPAAIGADLMTISAHKIHGPKGVGALYVGAEITKAKKLIPIIFGGGQEQGMRSGTENVIGIAGFGAAAAEERAHFAENCGKMAALRDLCAEKAASAGARPNVPAGQRAPHVLSLTLPSIKSETMLNFLSAKGFCVSAGSACSSHSRHISSSLVGFGLTEAEADSTIRVSFSAYNTEDEIIEFCQALGEGVETLVRIKR
jgi:cysteine desulfurase